jgi:uncharacterized integral membrane protein
MGNILWQDIVMTIGSIGFVVSLLPSVFSKDKPALTTSIMTAIILCSLIICYVSLGLYLSSVLNLITAILWIVLAIQKYKLRGGKNESKIIF